MNVTDILKKSLAFGVGAAAYSAEKVKQFADDMVARGEMSSDDARTFLDDVSKRVEEEKQTVQGWVAEQVSKMLQQAGAAQASRVAELEARVAALERGSTGPSDESELVCPTDESSL